MVNVKNLLRSTVWIHIFRVTAADQSKQMQEQMSGAALAMPNDPKVPFKAEWEGLEIVDHQWALADVESTIDKIYS